MSLKTWKQEFYPITALQAHKTLDLVGLVEHSIQKWIGLRKKNLEKHGLETYGFTYIRDSDDNSFSVDAFSCSLCRRFVNFRKEEKEDDCFGCPIFESRGHVRCCEYSPKETTPDSPYAHWQWDENPEPMIRALRKALRWAKKQGEK